MLSYPKQKAAIGNNVVLHGTSSALCDFKTKFPELKWSTANDWKNAVINYKQKKIETSRGQESAEIAKLVGKNRGRPPTLPEAYTDSYGICTIHNLESLAVYELVQYQYLKY